MGRWEEIGRFVKLTDQPARLPELVSFRFRERPLVIKVKMKNNQVQTPQHHYQASMCRSTHMHAFPHAHVHTPTLRSMHTMNTYNPCNCTLVEYPIHYIEQNKGDVTMCDCPSGGHKRYQSSTGAHQQQVPASQQCDMLWTAILQSR